jgi:hypothetical protein
MNKSKLSIFWQKSKKDIPQPKYSYDEISPQRFIGRVFFDGTEYVTTNVFCNVKDATDAAAKLALECLVGTENCGKSKNNCYCNDSGNAVDCKLILLIDLDNQMNGLKLIPQDGSVKVIGVGGPRLANLEDYMNCEYFNLWKTNSTTKDAADIELIWYACENYRNFGNTPIRIASADYILVNLATILSDKDYDCRWYPSIKEILTEFKMN